MKTNILVAVAAMFLLASCQREPGDPTPPVPQEEITTKMLIEYKFYDNGVLDGEGYVRYYLDTVANILYRSFDTVANIHNTYHYDASGRLLKIVYAFSLSDPTVKDSSIITRPTPNTFHFETVGAGFTETATVTNLAGGRKLIHVISMPPPPSPGPFTADFYMSADGKLDSSIRKDDTGMSELILTRKIAYNAAGAAMTVTDIWDNEDSPIRSVYTHTITRDNNDNTFLQSFVDNTTGSDLGWLAYDFESEDYAHRFFNDYYMTDNLMLLKGTILSYSTNVKDYDKATGAMVNDDGTDLSEYPVQYYNNGRLKSLTENLDGEIQKSMDLKYYN